MPDHGFPNKMFPTQEAQDCYGLSIVMEVEFASEISRGKDEDGVLWAERIYKCIREYSPKMEKLLDKTPPD